MEAWTRASETVFATARKVVAQGIRQAAALRNRRAPLRVADVMSTGVKTCTPSQSVADAAKVMWENDCGCVPVVDASGRPVGMITNRDICMTAYFRGVALAQVAINEAMSRKVVSVRPDDSIGQAEGLMREAQVRRLPVVGADGRVIGMLSLNDIAIAAEREQHTPRPPEIDLRNVALTLSAISKKRRSTPLLEAPHTNGR